MEPTGPQTTRELGCYTGGICDSCGNGFTRGMGVRDNSGALISSHCQWCVLLTLDIVTGFDVSSQVLDWARRKYRFGKDGRMHQTEAPANVKPGCHAFIVVFERGNIAIARCGKSHADIRKMLGVDRAEVSRAIQVPDSIVTHLHHDSGQCVQTVALWNSPGAMELREIWNAHTDRDGAVSIMGQP